MKAEIAAKVLAYCPRRFLARCKRVNSESACWEWNGAVNKRGYGVFSVSVNGRVTSTSAHSAAFVIFRRIVPADGIEVDHKCRNTRCVNPHHLEAVSASENQVRAAVARGPRAVCKYGHPKEGRYPGGKWYCKTCKKLTKRTSRRKP